MEDPIQSWRAGRQGLGLVRFWAHPGGPGELPPLCKHPQQHYRHKAVASRQPDLRIALQRTVELSDVEQVGAAFKDMPRHDPVLAGYQEQLLDRSAYAEVMALPASGGGNVSGREDGT